MCYYSYFGKLIIDRRLENKDVVAAFAKKYWVKKVVISVYHLQINKMIKCGHKLIIDVFLKISNGESTNRV